MMVQVLILFFKLILNKMRLNIYILMAFLNLACEKQSNIEDNSIPSIVWKIQHGPALYDQIAFDPIIYKNTVLFGYQTSLTQGYIQYDKNDGAIVKEFKNETSFDYFSVQDGSSYLSSAGSFFRRINLETGDIQNIKIDLSEKVSKGYPYFDDKYYYKSTINKNSESNDFSWYRCPKNNLNHWVEIANGKFDFSQIYPSFEYTAVCNFSKNIKGEEIIYFPSCSSPNDSKFKAYYKMNAFNLTTNIFEWQSKEFLIDTLFTSSLPNITPLIYENKVISWFGGKRLVAYDLLKGNVIWEFNTTQMNESQMHINGNKISILNTFGDFYLLNANNGSVLKKINIGAGASQNWASNNGVIYFTNALGNLYAIDGSSLEIKWTLQSPNKDKCSYCTFFNASPVVDPATNRLYISDRKEVICYQLSP
jgi:outer membrane protein assembly factor BamB